MALNMLPAVAGKAASLMCKGTNRLSKKQAGAVVDTAISVAHIVRPKD